MSSARAIQDRDCSVAECPNPAVSGELCEAHIKRRQRGKPMTAPVLQRPANALERLTEAALAYAEAEGDREWTRARDNLRKAASAYGQRGGGEAIRAALAELRAQGVRLGRPMKVEHHDIQALILVHGSQKRTAVALGVSVRTVRRALRRFRREEDKNLVSVP